MDLLNQEQRVSLKFFLGPKGNLLERLKIGKPPAEFQDVCLKTFCAVRARLRLEDFNVEGQAICYPQGFSLWELSFVPPSQFWWWQWWMLFVACCGMLSWQVDDQRVGFRPWDPLPFVRHVPAGGGKTSTGGPGSIHTIGAGQSQITDCSLDDPIDLQH